MRTSRGPTSPSSTRAGRRGGAVRTVAAPCGQRTSASTVSNAPILSSGSDAASGTSFGSLNAQTGRSPSSDKEDRGGARRASGMRRPCRHRNLWQPIVERSAFRERRRQPDPSGRARLKRATATLALAVMPPPDSAPALARILVEGAGIAATRSIVSCADMPRQKTSVRFWRGVARSKRYRSLERRPHKRGSTWNVRFYRGVFHVKHIRCLPSSRRVPSFGVSFHHVLLHCANPVVIESSIESCSSPLDSK